MLWAETGIDGDEAREAAKHETGSNGEKKREGHFRYNEKAAERLMAANAAPESTLFERVLKVHARKTQRGNETEHDGGKKRSEEGKKEHALIDYDGFTARQRRVLWNESEEAAQSQLSEEQPRGHARE
jgi:hypothetical protein